MSFRDGPFKEMKVPLGWAAAAAVALTLAGAIALMVTDHRADNQHGAGAPVRETIDRIEAPVGRVVSAPAGWVRGAVNGVKGYFFAVGENRKLKRQLKAMNDLEAQNASLKDLNERYAALLELQTDPPIEMVTGRAVTDSRGPFANSRLINVGSDQGVKVGNPAMSENGLVGRVIGVTEGVSRITLLTDVASRVPVMIDRTNARAILTGDGGPSPRLAYLRSRDPPQPGDVVVTSGDGGLFPRGLPVGYAVKGIDGSWHVQLSSDRAPIDYVRILKFQDFSQLADLERLARVTAPSAMAGSAPNSQDPERRLPLPSAPPAPTPEPKAAEPKAAEPKSTASQTAQPQTTAQPKAAPPPPSPAPKTQNAPAAGAAAATPAPQPKATAPATNAPTPKTSATSNAGRRFERVQTPDGPPVTRGEPATPPAGDQ